MFAALIEKLALFHLFSITSLILFTIFLYKWQLLLNVKCNKKDLNLPPSPPRLPIIGNLHQLGKLPHRSLRSLSQKYGDYMLLYLGNRPTLVVSSSTAAEQIMKTHDLVFANRPNLRFISKIFYDGNDVAFSSYGEKWRHRKSICVTEILNNKRVQSYRSIRQEEVGCLIETIKRSSGEIINLSKIFTMLFKGITCRTALGKRYDNGDDFYMLFKELVKLMGEVSVGDYVPFLGWVDRLTGLEGRVEIVRKRFDKFIEEVIQEHQIRVNITRYNEDEKVKNVKDFVDVLLEIQQGDPEELSTVSIKALILDIFAGGTETTSTTIEWAMTELIRHPRIMMKVQREVRSIVKANTRVIEDDLENLEYLKAVIKETLRLHPPAPLLVFRESSENVKIENYDISARTQVIINAWAIQLDPKSWQDPEAFIPERFFNNASSVDFKGQHFQFIPFGAGRRGCPGIAFGIVNAELVLASLVYEFNWMLPNGREGDTLDVDECVGITVGRRNPLMVIATPNLPLPCY
ncbi:Cytochrome P450 71A1 [Bienertia sinuspersici]